MTAHIALESAYATTHATALDLIEQLRSKLEDAPAPDEEE